MTCGPDNVHTAFVDGLEEGAHFGYRAYGPYEPENGLWFDPDKLLLDPYATHIDRAFAWNPALASRRYGVNTSHLVPKSVVRKLPQRMTPLATKPGPEQAIYELHVRSFTQLHPDIPVEDRGTLRALSHPSIISHLSKLNIGAVELMPINAWIDERHLIPLGLCNSWGYNPVSYFALDPRLAPGGIEDLRTAVTALHDAGIAVLMDVVYNHNGESDYGGATLSFRGLDPFAYFRHHDSDPVSLVNDTGCGNTLNCQNPVMRHLIHDSLRYFVEYAGIDGFRFDLAPILGRRSDGFDVDSPLMRELLLDPIIGDRLLIAEPWDIGPGGYQLGEFPEPWLEWNDKYRDDVRRFWRGDSDATSGLATRLAGSSDVYDSDSDAGTRSVNFIAAHDGFSLADTVAYITKHNHANGENNRDGHNANFSWNNGVEGRTDNPEILKARQRDLKALISTLFMSRGHIMITAGDEFGRTQQGNNNAYAQDNHITWLDWKNADQELLRHTAEMATLRVETGCFHSLDFLDPENVEWVFPDGTPIQSDAWSEADIDVFAMVWHQEKLAVYFNRTHADVSFKTSSGHHQGVGARSVSVICNGCVSDDQKHDRMKC